MLRTKVNYEGLVDQIHNFWVCWGEQFVESGFAWAWTPPDDNFIAFINLQIQVSENKLLWIGIVGETKFIYLNKWTSCMHFLYFILVGCKFFNHFVCRGDSVSDGLGLFHVRSNPLEADSLSLDFPKTNHKIQQIIRKLYSILYEQSQPAWRFVATYITWLPLSYFAWINSWNGKWVYPKNIDERVEADSNDQKQHHSDFVLQIDIIFEFGAQPINRVMFFLVLSKLINIAIQFLMDEDILFAALYRRKHAIDIHVFLFHCYLQVFVFFVGSTVEVVSVDY